MAPSPTVRVVVVNWNTPDLTIRCIESLQRTDYPKRCIEIVVVDNGSTDDSASAIAERFPELRLIHNEQNLGFAEGCNVAMRDRGDAALVALVNNDAVVEPQWLREMVGALMMDDSAGAVAATLILDPDFVPLDIEVVGGPVRVSGVTVDGEDVTDKVLDDGGSRIGDPDWPLRVSLHVDGRARMWIPAAVGAERASVVLERSGVGHRAIRAGVPGSTPLGLTRSEGSDGWMIDLPLTDERTEILNGVGTDLTEDLEGFDRGFGQPADPAQRGAEGGLADDGFGPWGFCGGGVLLRGETLDQIGLFDPRYFAYYEDTDLSWRMRRAGWSIVSAPGARIHHAFGASGGSGAPWFFFLNYRNWLLTVMRNGDHDQRRRAFRRAWDFTSSSVRGNVVGRIRRGRAPSFRLTCAWVRVWLAVAAASPRILTDRRSMRPARPGHETVPRVRSRLQPGPNDRRAHDSR